MNVGDVTRYRAARDARREVESALDRIDWRWSKSLSRWLDLLITIEESAK
jgi:hypothetical protein